MGSLCCYLGSSGAYRGHGSLSLSGFDPEGQTFFDHCGVEALIMPVFCLFCLLFFVNGHCTTINPLCCNSRNSMDIRSIRWRASAKVRRVNQVIPDSNTSVAQVLG